MYSTTSEETHDNNEMESFEKRKYWSMPRRFSPYEFPQRQTTYSGLESQDVLKTFQDSYERLRTDANGIFSEKKPSLTCSEKSMEHRSENTNDSSRDNNSLSYIGMIATAILRSSETKLTLAGIYTYMEKHFYGILSNRPGWRNTVRHNLSLHECFVKGEIAAEGKGRFWRIHPDYYEQFKCGKFNKNILQNSVPMFYPSLGNYRFSTPRKELCLSPFNIGYPGSTWTPTFYPFIPPSYPYPTLPFPQSTPSQTPANYQDFHRVPYRTCSSDCCASCPGIRHLPPIQCPSYGITPRALPIESASKSSSVN